MPQKRILIIDADTASRNFVTRILNERDYETLHASSGREGLISAWRDRPDLLIVDPMLTDIKGEEIAVKLRNDPRTANLPLVALSSDPSIERNKACIQAGFNEYIVKSGHAVSLLGDVVNRIFGFADGEMKQGGLLMVFLSAKGGAGTSSMCANIAMNIAQQHPDARLAVMDLVLPIGSIAPIVGYDGIENIVTIADLPIAKTTPEFFRRELPEIKLWKFHLLAGSPDPELSGRLNVGRIWEIINNLKGSHDYVLIDIGRALSRITLPIIQHADLVALMINTDISAIPLTKVLWDYLKNKGVHSNSIYTILNRAAGLEGASKLDVEKMLGITVNATFPYFGTNFAFANSQHQPFTLKFEQDTVVIIFQNVAKEMVAVAAKTRDSKKTVPSMGEP